MSNLQDLGAVPPRRIWDGVTARMVSGEHVDLAVVELKPEGLVPEHDHANEQLGMVIEGSVTFRIGDEERRLGPGGTWRIPSGTPHEVRAGRNGAVVIDVFAPGRDDWAKLDADPPSTPRWPA